MSADVTQTQVVREPSMSEFVDRENLYVPYKARPFWKIAVKYDWLPAILGIALWLFIPLNAAFVVLYFISNSTYVPVEGLSRLAVNISDAGSCDMNPEGCMYFTAAFVCGGLCIMIGLFAVSLVFAHPIHRQAKCAAGTVFSGLVLGLALMGVGIFHPDPYPVFGGLCRSVDVHNTCAFITFGTLVVAGLFVKHGLEHHLTQAKSQGLTVTAYTRVRRSISGIAGSLAILVLLLCVARTLYLDYGPIEPVPCDYYGTCCSLMSPCPGHFMLSFGLYEWIFSIAAYVWLVSQVMLTSYWSRFLIRRYHLGDYDETSTVRSLLLKKPRVVTA
ncbi:protein of unknown function DUF998 [Kipferlia bialata]|uniref:Uncharacterized protein n=1 Tax=Kipferlia bialata TaxID=797122 RepID=A0A9K3GHJ7_9EUKA|nr:protein of unknown function DUF998 [Kipferlia bialata]GIQ83278.1 protein of unknown function DUF998 [Kipferlia bialata]|eukprot:g1698.t1